MIIAYKISIILYALVQKMNTNLCILNILLIINTHRILKDVVDDIFSQHQTWYTFLYCSPMNSEQSLRPQITKSCGGFLTL